MGVVIEMEMGDQVQEGDFFTIYPFKLVDFLKPRTYITF